MKLMFGSRVALAVAGAGLLVSGTFGGMGLAQSLQDVPSNYTPEEIYTCVLLTGGKFRAAKMSDPSHVSGEAMTWFYNKGTQKRGEPWYKLSLDQFEAKLPSATRDAGYADCMKIYRGDASVSLTRYVDLAVAGMTRPEPKLGPMVPYTASELYPTRSYLEEALIDCNLAGIAMAAYTDGKPEFADWMKVYNNARNHSEAPKLDDQMYKARMTHFMFTLTKDEQREVGELCKKSQAGAAIEVNPYRRKLMGEARYAAHMAARDELRRQRESRLAAQRQEQERRLAAEREREEAERPERELMARCQQAATSGLESALSSLKAANRMNLMWEQTRRAGTNYAWEDFERGCRQIASTWKTLQNMDCPGSVRQPMQNALDNYRIVINGNYQYCRAEWQ